MCLEIVKGLLCGMYTSNGNILCEVEKRVCVSPVVDKKSTIIASIGLESLNFLPLRGDEPLGRGFKFERIYAYHFSIDAMH